LNRWKQAIKHMQIALRLDQQVHGSEHPDVAYCMIRLGSFNAELGRLAEGDALLHDGVAMQRRLLGENNPAVVSGMVMLAHVLTARGKPTEAEQLCRDALTIRKTVPLGPTLQGYEPRFELARALCAQAKFAEAEVYYRQAIDVSRASRGPDHPQLYHFFAGYGEMLNEQGRYPEAEAAYREALRIQPLSIVALTGLARALQRKTKNPQDAEAVKLVDEALAIWKTVPDPEDSTWTAVVLANALYDQDRPADATSLYRVALGIYRNRSYDAGRAALCDMRLGRILQAEGHLNEAESAFREALLIRRRLSSETDPTVAEAEKKLADCVLAEEGKTAQAKELIGEHSPTTSASERGFPSSLPVAHLPSSRP